MGTTYSHEWFMENIIESKDSNANRHKHVLCSVVVAASKSLNSQHLGPDHEQSLLNREAKGYTKKITRILKAALHKLPGDSSLNLRSVSPVCPVCPG